MRFLVLCKVSKGIYSFFFYDKNLKQYYKLVWVEDFLKEWETN